MCWAVRNALGPGLRSLSTLNSLQGGADQAAPSMPLAAMRSASLKWPSFKISNGGSDAMSNGCRQSACMLCMLACKEVEEEFRRVLGLGGRYAGAA